MNTVTQSGRSSKSSDLASGDGSQSPTQKRHRSFNGPRNPKACTSCSKRKIRCIQSESAETCTGCLKHGKVCEYGPIHPRYQKNSTSGYGDLTEQRVRYSEAISDRINEMRIYLQSPAITVTSESPCDEWTIEPAATPGGYLAHPGRRSFSHQRAYTSAPQVADFAASTPSLSEGLPYWAEDLPTGYAPLSRRATESDISYQVFLPASRGLAPTRIATAGQLVKLQRDYQQITEELPYQKPGDSGDATPLVREPVDDSETVHDSSSPANIGATPGRIPFSNLIVTSGYQPYRHIGNPQDWNARTSAHVSASFTDRTEGERTHTDPIASHRSALYLAHLASIPPEPDLRTTDTYTSEHLQLWAGGFPSHVESLHRRNVDREVAEPYYTNICHGPEIRLDSALTQSQRHGPDAPVDSLEARTHAPFSDPMPFSGLSELADLCSRDNIHHPHPLYAARQAASAQAPGSELSNAFYQVVSGGGGDFDGSPLACQSASPHPASVPNGGPFDNQAINHSNFTRFHHPGAEHSPAFNPSQTGDEYTYPSSQLQPADGRLSSLAMDRYGRSTSMYHDIPDNRVRPSPAPSRAPYRKPHTAGKALRYLKSKDQKES